MVQPYKIIQTTASGQFEVVVAQPGDTEEVMSLLVETAEWLKSRGSTQWAGLLEGKDSHNTADAIRRGDVFVFKQNQEIAGMVLLLSSPSPWDRELWGNKAFEGDGAVYLHRLAVRRKYARTGLGRTILNWCTSGIHFPGKEWMRLDCIADNPTLDSFYTANGYSYVGESGGFHMYDKAMD
jgi:ribosomal protein S18 acetylase RimI-like enzyme